MVRERTLYDRKRQRKYLNARERQLFIDELRKLKKPRKKALLLTLLFTGVRISEALDLRVKDIDFNDGCLVFETLKQRDLYLPRGLPVRPDLLNLLRHIIEQDQLKANDRIWTICRQTAWRWVDELLAPLGITGVRASPTGLRHGFAVGCSLRGITQPAIQTCMGHRSEKTTTIYLGVMGEELRELIMESWPT